MAIYTGWLLPEADRAKLLGKFPPVYHDVLAHHVTLRMGEAELPTASTGVVVGQFDDGLGCQVLVVQIDSSTIRPDGETYHITWSLDRDTHNRKPFHSIGVLKEHGWEPVWPVYISLVPMVFKDTTGGK
jgi:hypothetical protein